MSARYVAIPTTGPMARILPFAGVFSVLFVWWFVTSFGIVESAYIPSPQATVEAFIGMFQDGTIWRDGWASVRRVLYAIVLASLVGIPIGILMGTFGRVEAFLKWVIFPFRTAPIIAFIPIFFLIWGIDEKMKVGFLFFGTVVYIIPLTFDAIRAIPDEYVDVAVDYGFKPFGTMIHFLIPAAWPRIFDAIKVCTGIAWTYLVAAEIANVTTGLGAVVKRAERFQNTEKVWAGIIVILAIGVLTDYLLGAVRKRFFNWEA
ncbi:MAG: ABC transporter permease [Proteobacteria bacterium]|nr:ABC transporter permease [Pseudomonadota bacterium]